MQAQVLAATNRTGGSAFWNGSGSTRNYIYGGSYVDEVVAMQRKAGSDAMYYVHSGGLYSPQVLTSASGTVVEKYTYDAYGKRSAMTATGTALARSAYGWDRGFTGYILDDESGLYQARFRMFSATVGRFISRDPLRYPDGMNLYQAYFAPNKTDPNGLWEVDCKACTGLGAKKDLSEEINKKINEFIAKNLKAADIASALGGDPLQDPTSPIESWAMNHLCPVTKRKGLGSV